MEVQRRSWYMVNVLERLFDQIKWTYDPKYIREIFRSEDNIKVLVIIGGLRMEFTSDDDAINVFSVFGQTEPNGRAKRNPKSKPLTITFIDGTTLRGHYTYYSASMHTHFRFSPTKEGMLHLLKLVDHSMSQMMAVAKV